MYIQLDAFNIQQNHSELFIYSAGGDSSLRARILLESHLQMDN